MSRKNALTPLKDRMNAYQQARRADRIAARSTVADQLRQAGVYAIHHATELQRRKFWGRMKLVFLGK